MSDMDLNTRDKNFSQNQNTGSSQRPEGPGGGCRR